MSVAHRAVRKSLGRAVALASLALAAGVSQAATPFEVDVSTAIDRGLNDLAVRGAFTNPPSGTYSESSGLAMLALLEKRASGNPGDPAQGYSGANGTDQGRLRSAAAYILDRANETSFYSYRDGNWMFALSEYALTGGPDKSVLAPGNADYETIKQAMDRLVDRTLANQRKAPLAPANQGYWCYTNSGCEDSSTTQFAVAGLAAAKAFYSSSKSADNPFADPARVAQIDAALALSKQAYELNATTGSDNGSCNVMSASERGHGYNSFATSGYKPTLAQTASGVYIQLFGGATVNSPMVQSYIEWLRNHYRWQDLGNMGNFWASYTYWYYLWSSYKGMEFIRKSGIAPAAGNLGPADLGTGGAGACAVRQMNKDPATVARPAVFGAGGVGYYAGEPKGQYFDYAHQILSHQCADGSFGCNGAPGDWGYNDRAAYALLVLLRSTGGGCVDTDGDGVCDDVDNCPTTPNPGQEDTYGDKRGDACEPKPTCDADSDGDVDSNDINLIRAAIGQVVPAGDRRDANGDKKITINDVRACTLKCTRANCATN